MEGSWVLGGGGLGVRVRAGACAQAAAPAAAAAPPPPPQQQHTHAHTHNRGGWVGGQTTCVVGRRQPPCGCSGSAGTSAAGSDSTAARLAETCGHRAVRGGHMGTWDKPKRREGRQQPPGARVRSGACTRRPQSAFTPGPRSYLCLGSSLPYGESATGRRQQGVLRARGKPAGPASRHRRGRARWWACPPTTADRTAARWAASPWSLCFLLS